MANAKNNWPTTVTTNQERAATISVVLAMELSCQRRGNELVNTAVLISFLLARSFSTCRNLRSARQRSSPVRVCEAKSNEPKHEQDQWEDGWHKKQVCLAHCLGKYLLLAQEKGACSDKPSKTHAPQMARDALSACNTAAHEQAKVPCGGKEHHRTQEEVHAGRNSIVRRAAGDLCCTVEHA